MSSGSDGGSGGDGVEVVVPLSSSDSCSITRAYVSYSCGSCGYELNLSSCNRNLSVIDAEYGKTMKRGIMSFFSVDESRFTQINKIRWLPYLASNRTRRWRLFQQRTKLLCKRCGNYIGTAWNVEDGLSSSLFQVVKQNSTTWDGITARRVYEIKIRSLRPLSYERADSIYNTYDLSI